MPQFIILDSNIYHYVIRAEDYQFEDESKRAFLKYVFPIISGTSNEYTAFLPGSVEMELRRSKVMAWKIDEYIEKAKQNDLFLPMEQSVLDKVLHIETLMEQRLVTSGTTEKEARQKIQNKRHFMDMLILALGAYYFQNRFFLLTADRNDFLRTFGGTGLVSQIDVFALLKKKSERDGAFFSYEALNIHLLEINLPEAE